MKFVRIICLALSLVLSVTLLSACSLTTTNSVSAAIDADGVFSYIVVRPDVCDPLIEKGAKDIRNAIKENYGSKINDGVTIFIVPQHFFVYNKRKTSKCQPSKQTTRRCIINA